MNPKEAREYLIVKYELARELEPVDRRAFFLEEEATTRMARAAYIAGVITRTTRAESSATETATAAPEFHSAQNQIEVSVEFNESTVEQSREEQAILWAQDVMHDFKEITRVTGVKQKSQKDRLFIRSRLEAPLNGLTVLQQPDFFFSAFNTWHAQALNGSVRAQELVDTTVEQARLYIKEHWRNFDVTAVGGYVKAAAGDRLSAGTATHLLQAYFEGPFALKDKVQSYYTLAHSILGLSSDRKGLAYATRVANFQTDVLKAGSIFQTDLNTAYYASVDDLALMDKARSAVLVVSSAAKVTHSRYDEVDSNTLTPLLHPQDNLRLYTAIEKIGKHFMANGEQEFLDRLVYILKREAGDTQEIGLMFGTDLERNIERNDPTWFTSINTNSQDPLALRARATIGPRAGAETFAAMINGKPEAYEIARTEHLSLPHGQVVDIFIPAGLVPAEERQLIERVIEAARDKHTDIIFQSHKMQSISEVAVSKIEGKDGESVFYLYREAGEFDGLGSHTLNELLWVGLPYAESQSDNELNEGLIEVQDDMEKYQHRYINRRGVRINFELSTQLGSRGYKSIVFREDVRKSEYITVELEHATGSYNYKLDDSFNMILDKDMSSTRFRNQVHYSTLLLLRDYICGVILETEEGEMATAASGPAARIDYLRYLPIGQSSSPTAARNFLTRRKKDLLTKSEERKQFDPQGRSTTYVREVEQTNQNLPPLKIFVNPDDFLYDKIIANGFKLPPNIEA